jgi:hypothetical protein
MIRRSSAWLAVSLIGGVLLAGCGSSSTTTSATTSAPTSAATTPTSAATTPSSTSTPTSPSIPTGAGVAQAVAICKSVIQREPQLSAAAKAKVEGICNKAASGDLAGARAAAKEVCVEVINASPIPAASKEQALAACKTY